MKFYNRQIEIETIKRIGQTSHDYSQLTVVTGGSRIGKTTLIMHALEGKRLIYLFVALKSIDQKKVYLPSYVALSLEDM